MMIDDQRDNCVQWCCSNQQSKAILQGFTGNNPLPFAVKPDICLNKMSGPLPVSQSGSITLNCVFAPKVDVLYGADSPNAEYTVTNLQLNYQTIDEDDKKANVSMTVVETIRNQIGSANHIISQRIPIMKNCVGVSGSFIKTANLGNVNTNNVQLETLPNLSRIEFQLSDNNGYLSYPLLSREQQLFNYIQSNYGDRQLYTLERIRTRQ